MQFIADFHIHSHFSIATSRELVPEKLAYWAKRKGITVVGTGDFTHPGWLEELREKLKPAEYGLYALKDEYVLHSNSDIRFLLTAEISSIYKKYGKVRKIHNLVFAPDFRTVELIQGKLSKIGNIHSDGRPILGLDSRNLLELVLECSERCAFIPAHIWTPWFSALGAKSGFDTIDECYGDLSPHIAAVETGLSSDPPMNWHCSFLDRFTVISNSDAHSPEKLGREANLFDTELSYDSIVSAMKPGGQGFQGTVEFFPQEGKYHYDGHRKCGVRVNPLKSLEVKGLCPECGKQLTIGVLSRVAQLADRDEVTEREFRHDFYSVIPLKELLSEIQGTGVQSKRVTKAYEEIMGRCESELGLLIEYPLEEVKSVGGDLLEEAVARMRTGSVYIEEGYDGEYGCIRVFGETELDTRGRESSLFDTKNDSPCISPRGLSHGFFSFDISAYRALYAQLKEGKPSPALPKGETHGFFMALNEEQAHAVNHAHGPALVLAGPGTGKTRVLAGRIVRLVQQGVHAGSILAVTFSNRAAHEMRRRVAEIIGDEGLLHDLNICTFHAFGLQILKNHASALRRTGDFIILDDDHRLHVLAELSEGKGNTKQLSSMISKHKRAHGEQKEAVQSKFEYLLTRYEDTLVRNNAFDFDDLICKPLLLFREDEKLLKANRNRYEYLLIDEYQDINHAQYSLIRRLKPEPEDAVYAIGDPDQAIYGFRGADAGCIDRFVQDYPGARVYTLNRSYRCSSLILEASQDVVGRSAQDAGFLKGVKGDVKVKISEFATERSEAEFVARTIEAMLGGLRFFSMDSSISGGTIEGDMQSLSDFAVLCRLKQQMGPVVEALNNHAIPHQVVGTVPFYRDEPFSTIIDVLRTSMVPGIGMIQNTLVDRGIIERNDTHAGRWDGCSVEEAAEDCVNNVLHIDMAVKPEQFKMFFELCRTFGNDMLSFMHSMDLGTGADYFRQDLEQVSVMTMHAAKGLEFPCVFIIGCEDGLLPFTLLPEYACDVEEEKRLLYVAMTRAKRHLILSHVHRRFMYGKSMRLKRSRFLDAIEEEVVEVSQVEYIRKESRSDNQLELF